VAWNGKSKVFYLTGKYEDALTTFNRAIEIKPKVAGYWYYKSLALKSLHQDADAETALSKAKELGYKAPSTK
jgi:Flp pilus assembly protein TadD